MSKLVPPLPKFLRPAPPPPGEKERNGESGDGNGKPGRVDQLREGTVEGTAQVVGWLD